MFERVIHGVDRVPPRLWRLALFLVLIGAATAEAGEPEGVQRYSSQWLAQQQARPQRTQDIPVDVGWTLLGDSLTVEGSVRVLERETTPWVLMHEGGFDAEEFNIVRLRMRVSEGSECTLAWEGETGSAGESRPFVSLPLQPGPDIQEYAFDFTALETPFWTGRIARLWILPSDRSSHVEILGCSLGLACPAMPRQVTIGSQTHEAFRGSQPTWTLTIPPRGAFDVSMGILPDPGETHPHDGARFLVRLEAETASAALLDTYVIGPLQKRWASVQVDLSAYAGKRVKLTLRIEPLNPASECYAFWGNPMVSSLGTEPGNGPVILISCDTTRADHLSTYGYKRQTSPYLDRWSREAVLFETAVTTSTWTLPSHMSMFTGLIEEHHGVNGEQVLAANIPTLAEGLRAQGYVAAAFTGYAGILQPEWGPGRGFDTFDAPPGIGRSVFETLDAVKTWLQGHRRSKFFLFFHNYDVHGFHVERLRVIDHKALEQIPYSPADPKYLHFTKAYRTPPAASPELDRWAAALSRPQPPDSPIDDSMLECGIAGYDDAILSVDAALHDFFDYLKSLDLYEASTIIVTADHGEEFGEHGRYGHNTVYEECCRVPLLIKFPHGQFAGQRYPHMVQLTDLLPTVFDLLGAPLPARVDGESLLGPLRGQTEHRDLALLQGRCQVGARTNTWKAFVDNGGKGFQYHDLTSDPEELDNRASEQKDALDIVLAALNEAVGPQTSAATSQAPLSSSVAQPRTLSESEKEQLRAIGYLDADPSSAVGAPEAQSGVGFLSSLLGALIDGHDYDGASEALAKIPPSKWSVPKSRKRLLDTLVRGLAAPDSETVFFSACRTALDATPGNVDARRLAGRFAERQNDPNAAASDYLAALTLDPHSREIQRMLMSALEKTEATDEALTVCRKAQELAPADPSLWLYEAGVLESRKDLGGAVAACREAARRSPGDIHVWLRLGTLLLLNDRPEDALHAFRKAESIDSRDRAAVFGQVRAMEAQGNFAGAATACRKAAELDPNSADAWLNLEDDLRRAKDLDGAREAIRKARAVDPHSLEAATREIDLIRLQGDVPGAIGACRILAEERPDDAGVHRRLAALLEDHHDFAEALRALRKAQAIDSNDASGFTFEGRLHTVLGDMKAAAAAFRRATELQPNDADAWAGLGAALQRQDAKSEALDAFRKARTLDPQNFAAWFNEGLILSSLQDMEGAIVACRKASELQPGDVNIWLCLGNVLWRAGRFDEAGAALDKALVIAPGNVAALNASARNAQAQGKWADAAARCRKSIQARPNDVLPKRMLAEALEKQGDFKGVLDTYLDLLKINATDSQLVDTAARIILERPDTPGALEFARTLMSLRPNDGRPHWFAGMVLHFQRDLDGCIAELENALSLDPGLDKASQLLEKAKKERQDLGK